MNRQKVPFPDDVYALYPYGSRIYGTFRPDSDYDYILVVNKGASTQIVLDKNSYNVISREEFQKALNDHETWALECYFLAPAEVLVHPKEPWKFNFSADKLKTYFLEKMQLEIERAEKKFKMLNFLSGKKSLWHSMRVGIFGLQLLQHKRIVSYSEANPLWMSILYNPSTAWKDYEILYKPIYEALRMAVQKSQQIKASSLFPIMKSNTKRRTFMDSKKNG
jgi:predicted nucleotidyltransferase